MPTMLLSAAPVFPIESALFGRELLAVDGTRLKAVNSRTRNCTKAKLDKYIKSADERLISIWRSSTMPTAARRRAQPDGARRWRRIPRSASATTRRWLSNDLVWSTAAALVLKADRGYNRRHSRRLTVQIVSLKAALRSPSRKLKGRDGLWTLPPVDAATRNVRLG